MVKCTGRGLVVKRPGSLVKSRCWILSWGWGSFPLFQKFVCLTKLIRLFSALRAAQNLKELSWKEFTNWPGPSWKEVPNGHSIFKRQKCLQKKQSLSLKNPSPFQHGTGSFFQRCSQQTVVRTTSSSVSWRRERWGLLRASSFGEFKGQMNRGNRTERLWEGNPPLRGSLRGRVFRGFQRFFRGFQRFSEGFSKIFQRLSEVLSETLSEADFPLRGSQSCCP